MEQGHLNNFFGLQHPDKRQEPVFSALYVALSTKGVTKDDLFPRLSAVHICVEDWHGYRPDLKTILLPLTSRLEVLTIKYHGTMNINPAQICSEIGKREHLRVLNLLIDSPKFRQSSCVVPTIKILKHLTHLKIQSCLFTPDLLQCLETLPRLTHLDLSVHTDRRSARGLREDSRSAEQKGLAQSPEPLRLRNMPSVFPQLEFLSLQGPSAPMIDLFRQAGSVKHLRSLRIDVPHKNRCTVHEIENLIEYLPSACKSIQTFIISGEGDHQKRCGTSTVRRITYKTLVPLASLPHLEVVEISYSIPINITDDELVAWVGHCGSLRHLVLVHEPKLYEPPTLTFDVIGGIMRVRPSMMKLCLCRHSSRKCAFPLSH